MQNLEIAWIRGCETSEIKWTDSPRNVRSGREESRSDWEVECADQDEKMNRTANGVWISKIRIQYNLHTIQCVISSFASPQSHTHTRGGGRPAKGLRSGDVCECVWNEKCEWWGVAVWRRCPKLDLLQL